MSVHRRRPDHVLSQPSAGQQPGLCGQLPRGELITALEL